MDIGVNNVDITRELREAGANCVTVIRAVTRTDDVGSV